MKHRRMVLAFAAVLGTLAAVQAIAREPGEAPRQEDRRGPNRG